MSRHRNVRNMRYEDELSSDEYGMSYDDLKSYAVSPGTEAMFTYSRSRTQDHTLSSFMDEPSSKNDNDIGSDPDDQDDDFLHDSTSAVKMPQLDDVSSAKLQSGLETLEGILGDNCHQPTAVSALMKFDFDVERALDDILSKGGRQTLSLGPSSSATKKDLTIRTHNNDTCQSSILPAKGSVLANNNHSRYDKHPLGLKSAKGSQLAKLANGHLSNGLTANGLSSTLKASLSGKDRTSQTTPNHSFVTSDSMKPSLGQLADLNANKSKAAIGCVQRSFTQKNSSGAGDSLLASESTKQSQYSSMNANAGRNSEVSNSSCNQASLENLFNSGVLSSSYASLASSRQHEAKKPEGNKLKLRGAMRKNRCNNTDASSLEDLMKATLLELEGSGQANEVGKGPPVSNSLSALMGSHFKSSGATHEGLNHRGISRHTGAASNGEKSDGQVDGLPTPRGSCGELRLIGGKSEPVGGESRLIGGESRLIGGESRLIGGESRLIGGESRLIGGESGTVGGESGLVRGKSGIVGRDVIGEESRLARGLGTAREDCAAKLKSNLVNFTGKHKTDVFARGGIQSNASKCHDLMSLLGTSTGLQNSVVSRPQDLTAIMKASLSSVSTSSLLATPRKGPGALPGNSNGPNLTVGSSVGSSPKSGDKASLHVKSGLSLGELASSNLQAYALKTGIPNSTHSLIGSLVASKEMKDKGLDSVPRARDSSEHISRDSRKTDDVNMRELRNDVEKLEINSTAAESSQERLSDIPLVDEPKWSRPPSSRASRKRKASQFGAALGAHCAPPSKAPREKELKMAFTVPLQLKVVFKGEQKPSFFNFSTPSPDDIVMSKQKNLLKNGKRRILSMQTKPTTVLTY